MNSKFEVDGFRWAKGGYKLSEDRQRIERDPSAELVSYPPSGNTLKTVMQGAHDEDMALALVQEVGFLSVPANAAYEPVAACLEMAGNLSAMDVHSMFSTAPLDVPTEWDSSMNTQPLARLSDSAKAAQLKAAQRTAREAIKRLAKVNPEQRARHHVRGRALLFNQYARLLFRGAFDVDADPLVLVFRPANLGAWCWYALTGAASGRTERRACDNLKCKHGPYGTRAVFEVDVTDGNSRKRRFCPQSEGRCKAHVHDYPKDDASKAKTRKAIKPGGSK